MAPTTITTVWNEEHELIGFEGDIDELPEHIWDGRSHLAAVVMSGLTKLEYPVWLHPEQAQALSEVRLLDPLADKDAVVFEGVIVHLYAGPF